MKLLIVYSNDIRKCDVISMSLQEMQKKTLGKMLLVITLNDPLEIVRKYFIHCMKFMKRFINFKLHLTQLIQLSRNYILSHFATVSWH